MIAAYIGNEDIVVALLQATGINLDIKFNGKIAVKLATQQGFVKIAALINAKAAEIAK